MSKARMSTSGKCPTCGIYTSTISIATADMKPGESFSVNLGDLKPEKETKDVLCSTCQKKKDQEDDRIARIAADEITYCLVFYKLVGDDETECHMVDGSGRSTSKAHPKMQRVKGGPLAAEKIARRTFKNLGHQWRLLTAYDWTREAKGSPANYGDDELHAEINRRRDLREERRKNGTTYEHERVFVNGVLTPCHCWSQSEACKRRPPLVWGPAWIRAPGEPGASGEIVRCWRKLGTLARAQVFVEGIWPGVEWTGINGRREASLPEGTVPRSGATILSTPPRTIVAVLEERWDDPVETDSGEL